MKTARKIVFPYFYLWNIDGKMFEMNCSDAKHTGIGKAGTMSKAPNCMVQVADPLRSNCIR